MFAEFKKLILRGNILDLAIGIIIGSAFTSVVNSLVNDVIMPPVGLLLGKVDFSRLFISLSGTPYDSLSAAQAAGAPTINYGLFINNIISFLIVAAAVFLIVKGVRATETIGKKPAEEKPAAPTTKECPYCHTEIPIKATRCPHCTSQLES